MLFTVAVLKQEVGEIIGRQNRLDATINKENEAKARLLTRILARLDALEAKHAERKAK